MPRNSLSELEEIRRRFLKQLEQREEGALRRTIDQYGAIRDELQKRVERDWDRIEAQRRAGVVPGVGVLYDDARTRVLLEQIDALLTAFAGDAATETEALQAGAVRTAGEAVRAQLDTLLTPGETGSVAASFSILPVDALANLIGFASDGGPLARLFSTIAPASAKAIEQALLVSLAAGDNPRVAGRRIAAASNVAIVRSVRIARTEMMRAYRTAHHENYQQNSDVVKGWVWTAALNDRTCAACLSMHGTVHPLSEQLIDHANGRCTPVPITKTWAEMGLGERGWEETSVAAQPIESGEDWFRRQPAATWSKVLGMQGAEAYAAGRVQLRDFLGVRRDKVWGDSVYQRSLADAMKGAGLPSKRRQGRVGPTSRSAPAGDTGRLKPAGTPVSKALVPEDAIKPAVERLAAAIDKVHGDGALPALPIRYAAHRWELRPDHLAQYKQSPKDGRPYAIVVAEVAKQIDSLLLTLAHELGHFIDHAGIGDALKQYGSVIGAMPGWSDAVNATSTIRTLENHRQNMIEAGYTTIQTPQGSQQVIVDLKNLKYLLDPWEVFARSYSQYIAVRSGDKQLMREIDDERHADVNFPTQWDDNEFEAVAKAFDDDFRKRGWLDD